MYYSPTTLAGSLLQPYVVNYMYIASFTIYIAIGHVAWTMKSVFSTLVIISISQKVCTSICSYLNIHCRIQLLLGVQL